MEILKEKEFEELLLFAREHHLGCAQLPESLLRTVFETYKNTTLVYRNNGEIKGFAIYQEWPNFLIFLMIAGEKGLFKIMWWILHNKDFLPKKPFGFFDELRMKGRFVWVQR